MCTVRNIATLRKLERLGHITLHNDTGKRLTGLQGKPKVYYVRGGDKRNFHADGVEYELTYTDGCFYPFVEYAQRSN